MELLKDYARTTHQWVKEDKLSLKEDTDTMHTYKIKFDKYWETAMKLFYDAEEIGDHVEDLGHEIDENYDFTREELAAQIEDHHAKVE